MVNDAGSSNRILRHLFLFGCATATHIPLPSWVIRGLADAGQN